MLAAAQGESVKAAIDAGNEPVSLQVTIDGELAGLYKGKTREHLERVIRFRMQEAGINGQPQVTESGSQAVEQQSET